MYNEQKSYFSIIVPVYNVQKYLETCVDSVLQQSFENFELILVDDGSTDQSGEICDKLAERDRRITVIHQRNGGASAARNNGLRRSMGEYILFLDSDDFYPQEDFLYNIWRRCPGKDVVCFNYARYTDRLNRILIDFPEPEQKEVSSDKLLLELVRRNAYTSSACLKAVKRQLLQENHIEFEEGTSGEDIEWNARLLCAAKEIAIAPECIYAYRVREDSLTQNISANYVKMLIRIQKKLIETPVEVSAILRDAYYGYIAFQYSTLMINARLCKPRLDKENLKQVRELSWLLRYDANRLVKLIHMVYRILGFEITSWLLLIYFKLFCN